MPIYRYNNKTYDVPESDMWKFEKHTPGAKLDLYDEQGNEYSVPVSDIKKFKRNVKDWRYDKPSVKVETPIKTESVVESPVSEEEEDTATTQGTRAGSRVETPVENTNVVKSEVFEENDSVVPVAHEATDEVQPSTPKKADIPLVLSADVRNAAKAEEHQAMHPSMTNMGSDETPIYKVDYGTREENTEGAQAIEKERLPMEIAELEGKLAKGNLASQTRLSLQTQLDKKKERLDWLYEGEEEQLRNDIADSLGDLKGEFEEMYKEESEKSKARLNYPKHNAPANPMAMSSYVDLGEIKTFAPASRAKHNMDRITDVIAEYNRVKSGGNWFVGAAKGLQTADFRQWDYGVVSGPEEMALAEAMRKHDAGEQLTKAEEVLLDTEAMRIAVEQAYKVDWSESGFGAGQITAESLPFMAQMMANPASGLGKGLTKGSLGLLSRYAARHLTRNAPKMAQKAAVKTATAGTRLMGDVAGATVMTGTTGAPAVLTDAERRAHGDVQYGADYRYGGHTKGDSYADALRKSAVATTIDNFTEMFPLVEGATDFVGKGLKHIAPKKVAAAIDRTLSSDFAKGVDNFAQKTQWHGPIEEYFEEVEAGLLNMALVGDEEWDEFWTVDKQMETFLGVALMGGSISAMKTLGYRSEATVARKDADKLNTRMHNALGADWDALEQDLRTPDRASQVLADMRVQGYDTNIMEAALQYAQLRAKQEGAELAEMKLAETNPTVAQAHTAYDSGEAAVEIDQKAQVETDFESADAAMREIFGENDMALLEGEDFIDVANQFIEHGADAEVVGNYINARSAHEGMLDRLQTEIDALTEGVDAEVDAVTNRETGNVQGVKMKDGSYAHVVTGQVALREDGSIDKQKSSNSLVIYQDGRLSFTNPSLIEEASAPVSAEEHKQQKKNDIEVAHLEQTERGINEVKRQREAEETIETHGRAMIRANENGGLIEVEVSPGYEEGKVIVIGAKDVLGANVAEIPMDQYQQLYVGRPQTLVDEGRDSVAPNVTETATTDATETATPQAAASAPTAEVPLQTNTPAAEETLQQTSDTQSVSAKSRIPVGENGELLYEKAEADDVWDSLLEDTEGDAEIAQTVADRMVEQKKANLKTVQGKKAKNAQNVTDIIAAEKARKAEIVQAQQELEAWEKIAGTMKRRQDAVKAEELRRAQEAESLRKVEAQQKAAEKAETLRQEREALHGVPDMTDDTPQDARARGYRRVNGNKVDRQAPLNGVAGKDVEVKFTNGVMPQGRVMVIEANELQPSHTQGQRNAKHFIDEAQPKERKDAASKIASQKIAENIRPEEITTSVTAYTGAPTTNSRGEVIQGNSRSDALKQMWDNYPEQAAKYKQYLIDHAEELGLDAEAVAQMERPVLVNMLDVADNEAITLGQYVAQDTESGGTERIKAKNVLQKMGSDVRNFANRLLQSADEETSFAGLIDANGADVIQWMAQKGYITPTQQQSAYDGKGNLTAEAKNDLRSIMYQSIFKDGNTLLEEMFNALPVKAQKAILATAYRDFDSPVAERMLDEVQSSIRAFYVLAQDPAFASAKNITDARAAVEAWKNQYQMDDVTGESYLPSDKFSNFALHLATMYKGENQSVIQGTYNKMFDLIQGIAEPDLFNMNPDTTPRILVAAIKETLNIDYNGQHGSDLLASGTTASQGRQQGSDGNAASRKQNQDGQGTDDGRRRTEGDSGRSRNDEEREDDLQEVEEVTSAERTEMENRIVDSAEQKNAGENVSGGVNELIAQAERETDVTPTEGQKKAGNYKKGKVKVAGYEISIEQPKGSVRSGVDAKGNAWEQTMHNTYGYFLGTEGVDGDHIDVFLANDMDAWNGEQVFVVDQYNEDGSFDEHKVMLGFNSIEEAQSAYLSNYEDGWADKHNIVVTGTSASEFKNWVDSSHRKTKAFADYKTVKTTEGQSTGDKLSPIEGYTYDEVIESATNDIQNALSDADFDIEIAEVWAHGSRMRGDAKEDSDLDVVLFYKGDSKEDSLFNAINEAGISINGINVDVNPIQVRTQKDIDRYKQKSAQYDAGVRGKRSDSVATKGTEQSNWDNLSPQERLEHAENNPLTAEEIENLTADEVNKANAIAYLNGTQNLITQISYLQVYEDVRIRPTSAPSDNGVGNRPQLAEADSNASTERGRGGESRTSPLRTGKEGGTDRERVSDGGAHSEGESDLLSGESGDNSVRGSQSSVDGVSSRGANSGRGGTTRSKRSDGGRDGRSTSHRNTEVAGKQSSSIDEELNAALGDFKAVLSEFTRAGRETLSISIAGLNNKQLEILPKLISAGTKVGYAFIKKGVTQLNAWAKEMKALIGNHLSDAGLTDVEVDAFIEELWNSHFPIGEEVHTIGEWASILGMEKTRSAIKSTLKDKKALQDAAEGIRVKIGDATNIAETLPFLLPQQQDDVLKAETQFFDESHNDREHAFGKGYMFTNGTGTGKTYTGLGIVKRFIKQGKGRILIVTPSQQKVTDWIGDAKNLNIPLRSLDDFAKEQGTTATQTSGEGAVITTFANFRENAALLEGVFDLVVYDESHRILENKQGTETAGARQHYMVTNRDANSAFMRLREINPKYKAYREAQDEYNSVRDAEVEKAGSSKNIPGVHNPLTEEYKRNYPKLYKAKENLLNAEESWGKEEIRLKEQAENDAKVTKVVFLSATPFNTRDNLDYAERYIFTYPEEDPNTVGSYKHQSPRTRFYLEYFGGSYKFRYGRLEKAGQDSDVIARQEIAFSDYLQNTLQTMSGRVIDSEYDYSRDFPTVSLAMGDRINDAISSITEDESLRPLWSARHKVWYDYNYSNALFETMKISAMAPRLKQHLDAGRKVVIFHRRVETKHPLTPPFALMLSVAEKEMHASQNAEEKKALKEAILKFRAKNADLLEWEKTLNYSMPREQLAQMFGNDKVLFFSGKESAKVKNDAVSKFNDDNSGKNIIVIQEASGKEGISLHDRTGKHQRVVITLALPQSPITALQIEGRIYRIGNKSNAIFEYPILGLDSEMVLFGQNFNKSVSTTENLALGSQARNLRDSFARGIEERSGDIPIEEQGVGGKEADASKITEQTPYDNAILDYYTNQKITARRDQREGVDYYPTPEPLGFMMNEWGGVKEGDELLEPSAGHGAIARYAPTENKLTAIEPSGKLFSRLQIKVGGASGRNFVNDIFENYNIVNKHDVILMNPPFGVAGKLAAEHVEKAFKHLTEGGRIVAIVPEGKAQDRIGKWLDSQKDAVVVGEVLLPDVTFKQAGTNIKCRVVVIDKITNERKRLDAAARKVTHNLGYVETIEEFFNELQNVSMPDRTIDTQLIMQKRAKRYVGDLKDIKGVKEVVVNQDSVNVRTKGWRNFFIDWSNYSGNALKDYLARQYKDFANKIVYADESSREIMLECQSIICKLANMTEDEMERYISNMGKGDTLYRSDNAIKNRIEALFNQAISGEFKGKPISIGRLTDAGKAYLEQISGVAFKEYVDFVLNPSDLIHIYKDHFGNNEKDKGQNIPLDIEDIRNLVDVISNPDKVVFFKEEEGSNRNMFYFFKEAEDGTYNLMEIYSDRKGNLTAKTFYKTRKDATQRVMDIEKSLLPTSETYSGAILSNAKIPQMFESASVEDDFSAREGDGSFSDDALSGMSDPMAKMLGASTYSARQRREFAERARKRMVRRAESIAKELHLDNVEVVTDVSVLPEGKKRSAKGFYSKSTGKITVVVPNHAGTYDIQQTVLHEAVAHYGLRQLFGTHFDTFLDNVFINADMDVRSRIVELSRQNGWNIRTATEEYLATLAENIEFSNAHKSGWWSKIKGFFLKMLADAGVKLDFTLSDNELRYILWRSYQNLANPGKYASVVEQAADIGKQYDLKVGNYRDSATDLDAVAEQVREREDVLFRDGDTETGTNDDATDKMTRLRSALAPMGIEVKESDVPTFTKWSSEENCLLVNPERIENYDTLVGFAVDDIAKNKGFAVALGETEKAEAFIDDVIADVFADLEGDADFAEAVRDAGYDVREAVKIYLSHIRDYVPEFEESGIGMYLSNRLSAALSETYGDVQIFAGFADMILGSLSGRYDQGVVDVMQRVAARWEAEHRRSQSSGGDGSVPPSDGNKITKSKAQRALRESREQRSARVIYEENVKILGAEFYLHGLTKAIWNALKSKSGEKLATLKDNMKRLGNEWVEVALDRTNAVRQLQRAIEKAGGEVLQSFEDVWRTLGALSSKNYAEMQEVQRKLVKPLAEVYADIKKRHGYTHDEIEKYLYCKHALERNVVMGQRKYEEELERGYERVKQLHAEDAQNLTEREFKARYAEELAKVEEKAKKALTKDYSGLKELLKNDVTSNRYTTLMAAAQKVVDDFESKVEPFNVNKLWNKMKALSDFALKKEFDCGLISRELYNDVREMYQNYVPLRGWENDAAGNFYHYNTDIDVFEGMQRAFKRAYGRTSQAKDIMGHMIAMANTAIMCGNKNMAKQKFLFLAENHPNDVMLVSDVWYHRTPDGSISAVTPNIHPSMTPEEVAETLADFEAQMKAEEAAGNAKRYKSDFGKEIGLHMTTFQEKQHGVRVMINGKEKMVWIVGDPRAAMVLNGSLSDRNEIGIIRSFFNKLMRFQNASNTSMNLNFLLGNVQRDFQTALNSALINKDAAYAKKFTANYAKIMGSAAGAFIGGGVGSVVGGGIGTAVGTIVGGGAGAVINTAKGKGALPIVGLMRRYNNGTLDMSNEMDKAFYDFAMNGGITGITSMLTVEDAQDTFESQVDDINGGLVRGTKNVVKGLFQNIELTNNAFENATRFATFLTSREMGSSMTEAVMDAKEHSVNFNMRGTGSWFDVKYLFTCIAFANASLQALRLNLEWWGHSKSKTIASFLGYVAMGIANAVVMSLLFGDDDDDDNVNDEWYGLSRFNRYNNFNVLVGDGSIKVSIPHEFRASFAIGNMIVDAYNGKISQRDAIAEILAMPGNYSPVGLIGPGTDITDVNDVIFTFIGELVPTVVAKDIYDLVRNENYLGSPIHNIRDYNKDLPEFQRAGKRTFPIFVEFSKFMNDLAGGAYNRRSGGENYVNNPSVLQYLLEQRVGGGLMMWVNAGRAVYDAFDPKSEVDVHDIPFAKAVWAKGGKDNVFQTMVWNDFKVMDDAFNLVDKELKRNAKTKELSIDYRLTRIAEMEQDGELADYFKFYPYAKKDEEYQKLIKAAQKDEDDDEVKRLRQEQLEFRTYALGHMKDATSTDVELQTKVERTRATVQPYIEQMRKLESAWNIADEKDDAEKKNTLDSEIEVLESDTTMLRNADLFKDYESTKRDWIKAKNNGDAEEAEELWDYMMNIARMLD